MHLSIVWCSHGHVLYHRNREIYSLPLSGYVSLNRLDRKCVMCNGNVCVGGSLGRASHTNLRLFAANLFSVCTNTSAAHLICSTSPILPSSFSNRLPYISTNSPCNARNTRYQSHFQLADCISVATYAPAPSGTQHYEPQAPFLSASKPYTAGCFCTEHVLIQLYRPDHFTYHPLLIPHLVLYCH